MAASRNPADYDWVCSTSSLDAMDPPFTLENTSFAAYPNSTWPSDLSKCTNNTLLSSITWAGLCERMGGEWSRYLVHFDNVAYAYLALFQVATFEGWMEVMEASTDAPLAVSCIMAICGGVKSSFGLSFTRRCLITRLEGSRIGSQDSTGTCTLCCSSSSALSSPSTSSLVSSSKTLTS